MTKKTGILEDLDEGGLLIAQRINEALLANDRAKYYMTLLQLACHQAEAPEPRPNDLARERRYVQVADAGLDRVIPNATLEAPGTYRFDLADKVLEALKRECTFIIEVITEADPAEGSELARRLRPIIPRLALDPDGMVTASVIRGITSGDRGAGDSLHLVLMDAHRALNRLQRAVTGARIAGAAVYGLREEDRPLVAAFMRGVNRTSHLKFDHPGLDTTATRIGDRLIIQNDIGTTDAHVFVLGIEENTIQITYTDVHSKRLGFFQTLLGPLDIRWMANEIRASPALPESDQYILARGMFREGKDKGVEDALERIGASLVFLIDWNRARKRMRIFLRRREVEEVLTYAAENELGHRALLELGGEEFVYEILELSRDLPARYGEPLYSVVGRRNACEFLKEVCRLTSLGLRAGESEQLIRDKCAAALLRHLGGPRRQLLELCRKQAVLAVEGPLTIRDMLRATAKGDQGFIRRARERIERWEQRSDDLLNDLRRQSRRRSRGPRLTRLSGAIDDAVDEAEEVAYLLTLLDPEKVPPHLFARLEGMADIAIRAAQEFFRALAAAADGALAGADAEISDFIESIDRLDALEHRGDEVKREFRRVVLAEVHEPACLMLLRDLEVHVEAMTNSLARAGYTLHEAIFRAQAQE